MSDTDSISSFASDEPQLPYLLQHGSSLEHPELRRSVDRSGRRGSAAGQLDLVTQAQKGLGPSISVQEVYIKRSTQTQYDLTTQAKYGLGPTVSLREPIREESCHQQFDLITQARYGLGMTVSFNEPVDPKKVTKIYNLSTQAASGFGPSQSLSAPYKVQPKVQEQFDLSSQFRKGL